MAKNKSVIGLDLSLTSTGWACNGETGVVAVKAKNVERLSLVKNEIEQLLLTNNNPAVVIEGYSFASRNSQAHSIGELGGVIRLLLYDLRIPYIEIPPTVRAKFATGRGNAGKNEVVSAVSARTGIVWSGAGADDRCDAFILEEMGLTAIGRNRFDWPSENRSALDKIDWTELETYCA